MVVALVNKDKHEAQRITATADLLRLRKRAYYDIRKIWEVSNEVAWNMMGIELAMKP